MDAATPAQTAYLADLRDTLAGQTGEEWEFIHGSADRRIALALTKRARQGEQYLATWAQQNNVGWLEPTTADTTETIQARIAAMRARLLGLTVDDIAALTTTEASALIDAAKRLAHS
ncbi:hypothetical protein [Saccharothrix xinjiangensis]|uniref:DUF222 domain-containing protein n=1 Tax=Saccharothrix xinjiangensis TaxID=204798 RepID=A0ABV9XUL5_9PSEU